MFIFSIFGLLNIFDIINIIIAFKLMAIIF